MVGPSRYCFWTRVADPRGYESVSQWRYQKRPGRSGMVAVEVVNWHDGSGRELRVMRSEGERNEEDPTHVGRAIYANIEGERAGSFSGA